MKKYIKPNVHIQKVELDNALMAASGVNTNDLSDVEWGGVNNDENIEVDSKGFSSSSLWDED